MRTFDYHKLPLGLFDREVGDAMARLFEDRGKLSVLEQVNAPELSVLTAHAHTDSVEASTRIEGIYLDRARIEELLAGAEPVTDDESQIVGYSRALRSIEDDWHDIPLDTGSIVRLYETLYSGRDLGRKSRYRRKDYMYTLVGDHMQAVPVSPVPAFETPLVLGGACDSLAFAFDVDRCSTLVMAAVFTVDFLCIRPFEEGNARIARLFANLLMMKAGFNIGRYVSVERVMEQHAMDYYNALNACVEGWESGKADYAPYALFWFEKLHAAYQELFERIDLHVDAQGNKALRVKLFVERAQARVTKADVLAACPDISVSTVENELGRLVRAGLARKVGGGRSTAYEWVGESAGGGNA